MKALVIFESMYGNTHAVADAVAQGLGPDNDVEILPVYQAESVPEGLSRFPSHSTALVKPIAPTHDEDERAEELEGDHAPVLPAGAGG